MRTHMKTLLVASALVAGLGAAPLYADSNTAAEGTKTLQPAYKGGMMDHRAMAGQNGMMGQGGMHGQMGMMGLSDLGGQPGMMKMMGQMGEMMKTHTKLMQTMLEQHKAAQPETK
ncbi:MAG: hypothetical protein ACTSY1_05270 [Alphaproteobacteria bacterium]